MLSYNDALLHINPNSASCVVCHDLIHPDYIIWHTVTIERFGEVTYSEPAPTVPICIDCADLFHDVKRG